MNIVLNYDEIAYNNIFFNDAVKNTVINDSNFIKIIYSNKDLILNGIYIKINIYKNNNNNNNNNIINDIDNNNNNIINDIDNLEKYILTLYNNIKICNYKIKDQLGYLIAKLNTSNKNMFSYILKISGIWETQTTIGITYKFIFV